MLTSCSWSAAAVAEVRTCRRYPVAPQRLPRLQAATAQPLVEQVPVQVQAPSPVALVADFMADEQTAVMAALLKLQHPSNVQPSNLLQALQALQGALLGLSQLPSSRGWGRALLASPLYTGLLTCASQLLEQPQVAAALGPEAPLLVLEALSHLGSSSVVTPGDASRQAEHCRRMWRHANFALGDAADAAGQWVLHNPDLMTPDMIVRYYEACARAGCLAGAPSKSPGMGLMLRSQLFNRRFTTEESVRLLAAWAQLRRRGPFNPDSYNFSALAGALAHSAGQLSSEQLQVVAASAPAFAWPVYRSMPLLHAVCREAVHRAMAGSLPLLAAQRTLSLAVRGVAAMHPRLAHDLQAATCDWMRDAPTATLLQPAALNGGVPAAGLLAATSDCSNNALPCPGPALSPLASTTAY